MVPGDIGDCAVATLDGSDAECLFRLPLPRAGSGYSHSIDFERHLLQPLRSPVHLSYRGLAVSNKDDPDKQLSMIGTNTSAYLS